MKRFQKHNVLALSVALLLLSFTKANEQIRIYLIGDSTMSIKDPRKYPETGWGMPFAGFFDKQTKVDNRAQNGRSTKSFIAENRWKSVLDSLKSGDYVFIQFGHNDEVETKKTYTTPEEFKNYLRRYVNESREKQAKPILITPVSRRKFSSSGQAEETHPYSPYVRDVAAELQVPLIDLDQKSIALYQKLGEQSSMLLFNHLAPGVHPNFPDGSNDNTHFNELGAREIAQLVLQEVKKIDPELALRIRR